MFCCFEFVAVALFFLLFWAIFMLYQSTRFLHRTNRWYYLRAMDQVHFNRQCILQQFPLAQEYEDFDQEQLRASPPYMPPYLAVFLDRPGTCPECGEWQRCKPGCDAWTEELAERRRHEKLAERRRHEKEEEHEENEEGEGEKKDK